MKIYTGFGDSGKTMLHGGEVVDKNHLRVEAYGTMDELNAWIGLIHTEEADKTVKKLLLQIQEDIFTISSFVATPPSEKSDKLLKNQKLPDPHYLEKNIDELDAQLKPLTNFILPGGTKLASYYHIARTVCRRAERLMSIVNRKDKLEKSVIVYINRLSDLLFVLARFANSQHNAEDIIWKTK